MIQKKNNTYSSLDRFIPTRKGQHIDLSHYKLTKRADSPIQWRWPHETDMKHDNLAREYFLHLQYEKRLTDALLPQSKKILNFSDSNSRKRKRKDDYQTPERHHWPNRARKAPQIRSPNTILDMPDLPTEITHQVIDWSKRGNVATLYQNDVYLWSPDKSEPYLLTSNEEFVGNFVRWNRTGDHLAISLCNRICVWYFPKKKEPKEIASKYCCFCLPECTIISIEWSKSDDIIIGCTTGRISVLRLPQLKQERSVQMEHWNGIIALKLSKDETLLAVSSLASSVEFLEWPSLKSYFEIDVLSAPTKALAWHPWKNSLFCLGTLDGVLTLWNVVTQSLVAVHVVADAHIDCLTWSELTGELVVSYWLEIETKDGEIRQDNRVVVYSSFDKIVDAIKWHIGRVPYLVWNHDGTQLATAGTDENMCVWDFIDANTKKQITKKKKLSVNPIKNLNAFGTCIR